MQIIYEDDSVRELFEDLCDIQNSKGLMRKQIGAELTRQVKKRFDQIKSANNFQIYLTTGLGRPHSLTGEELKGCYGVSVTANWRLVLEPVVDELSPETLKKCDVIRIRGVVDYHGKGSKNNWLIP